MSAVVSPGLRVAVLGRSERVGALGRAVARGRASGERVRMRLAVAGGAGAQRVDGVGLREGGYRIDAGQATRPGQLIARELVTRKLAGCELIALELVMGELVGY